MSSFDPTRARRQRMSRFRKILLAVTSVAHVPFVVAAAELARRLGAGPMAAWSIGVALALAGVLLFFGRAQHLAEDWHRPWWQTWLVDLPYFCHWSACIYGVVPSIVYCVVEPLVDLARGAPPGPSPSFFMWCYASGLVVSTYACTVRRRGPWPRCALRRLHHRAALRSPHRRVPSAVVGQALGARGQRRQGRHGGRHR
jgi:hypothetical protein